MAPIYDWDGTANNEISKLYDWDGTTNNQIGKVYDWDGTANSLIYSSDITVIPNAKDYPASAYSTWAEDGSRVTFTVDETGCNFYNRGSGSDSYDGERDAGIALNFNTEGHKYLNISYVYRGSSSGCHYRLKVGTNAGPKNTYDKVISTLIENYCSKDVKTGSSKIDISAYSNVGVGIYLHPSQDEDLYVNITSLTLTDE